MYVSISGFVSMICWRGYPFSNAYPGVSSQESWVCYVFVEQFVCNISLINISVLMTLSCCFEWKQLCCMFEVKYYDVACTFVVVALLRIALAVLGLLWLHMNFLITFPIYVKNTLRLRWTLNWIFSMLWV
jgi:hypothetical protein